MLHRAQVESECRTARLPMLRPSPSSSAAGGASSASSRSSRRARRARPP